MASRKPLDYPVFQAFDANGKPLSGGTVEFFDAGTTDQRNTYSDPELTTANPNPVTLNSRGEPQSGGGSAINVYLDGEPYKIVLKDSDGVTVRTIDDYVMDNTLVDEPVNLTNATDQSTDVFEGTLNRDPTSGETFVVDFQSSNTTTAPTFENTSGTLGALTIKQRDGSILWAGALDGAHNLYYDGTDLLVLNPDYERGSVPEHATDSATDAFVSATNTGTPGDGNSITRDFQSANTTTTPTLDGKTITDRDGNALWAGAINGEHSLQYASGTDTYLLLGPNPDANKTGNSTVRRDSGGRINTQDPVGGSIGGGNAVTKDYINKLTRGHIAGLELSNGTDASHDIDIATGVCSMQDGGGNRTLFNLTSVLTKQIDAEWAEGDDAGGFPSGLTSGTPQSDTWYHVFLIGKNNGSIDAGFDTDLDANNLLSDASDYSWYRRIGSVLTSGSSNIRQFIQINDQFWWESSRLDFDGTWSTSASLTTISTPEGVEVLAYVVARGVFSDNTETWILLLTHPDQADQTPDTDSHSLIFSSDSATARSRGAGVWVGTDANSQIRHRSNSGVSGAKLQTMFWLDPRGRNA